MKEVRLTQRDWLRTKMIRFQTIDKDESKIMYDYDIISIVFLTKKLLFLLKKIIKKRYNKLL